VNGSKYFRNNNRTIIAKRPGRTGESQTAEAFGFQAIQACQFPSLHLFAATARLLRKDLIRKGA
jgi:hypothetical protein